MSQHQKNPQCSPEQSLQTHSETQALEVAQVSKALEETHLSSHPLMPGSSKEAPDASMRSAPEGTQSFHSSSIAITATSSSKSDEPSGNQEQMDSSASSDSLSDTENLPVDLLDEKVNLLVEFLLRKYQMNEPITKADMIDAVIEEYREQFPEILRGASEYMEFIFGVDLKEVDPTSHCYAFVNKLGLTCDFRLGGEEGVPKTGILIFILGVIFFKSNRATEEEIWEVLNVMGLYSGRNHIIFGEPRKFITKDLVREKYLEYQQVPNSDPPSYEFLWGPRAHAEVSKMQLLEFLTKVHKSDPNCFPSQLEEALREEAERGYARALAGADTAAMASASSSAPSSSSSYP